MNDDDIKRMFERLDLGPEPPMAMIDDDLHRGHRRLRTRRLAGWTAGAAGTAVLATGVAVALPGGPGPEQELGYAGGVPADASTSAPVPTPTPTGTATPSSPPDDRDEIPSPNTRQLLLDTAAEHFDPDRSHLPDETSNGGTGGAGDGLRVSTKLDWVVPGEDGLGMVEVAVTTPDYVSEEFALEDFATHLGCELGTPACAERAIPGTDETAWVSEGSDADHVLTVMHERADGSLVGVRVSTLFGNNSLVPVSSVDIDLDQAFDFVTDPDLEVDPQEAKYEPSRVTATAGHD